MTREDIGHILREHVDEIVTMCNDPKNRACEIAAIVDLKLGGLTLVPFRIDAENGHDGESAPRRNERNEVLYFETTDITREEVLKEVFIWMNHKPGEQ